MVKENLINEVSPQASYKAGRTLIIESVVSDDVGLIDNQPQFNWTTPNNNLETDIVLANENEYTFMSEGEYQLQLSATDNNGQTTTTQTLVINVLGNEPPQITNVNINGSAIASGQQFTFYKGTDDQDNITTNINFTINSRFLSCLFVSFSQTILFASKYILINISLLYKGYVNKLNLKGTKSPKK